MHISLFVCTMMALFILFRYFISHSFIPDGQFFFMGFFFVRFKFWITYLSRGKKYDLYKAACDIALFFFLYSDKWRHRPPRTLLAAPLSQKVHPQNTPLFSSQPHARTQNTAAASSVSYRKCSISSSDEGCDIWPQGFNERLCV